MKKLLVTLAVAALAGGPLAAQAQDRDGYQAHGQGGYARSAATHGYDADARAYGRDVRRDGGARYGDVGRDRFARGGFDGRRMEGDRDFFRRDRDRFRGDVAFGLGYGGYPYDGYGGYDDYYGGGYYDAAPYDGYGADYAYSYPDEYGTYQPFDYSYSAAEDAYYAQGAPYADDEAYYGAPDAGRSEERPAADCGRWAWRHDRDAWARVPAPCERIPRG